jgi:O-antigen/teichoic acid export membrane protein
MQSVLLPLLSRAYAHSEKSFWDLMHQAAEGLIVVGTPIVVILLLGADLWIGIVFGPSYGPAALSLAAIAPHFVFTYLAVLYSMALIVLGRGWTLTSISICSVLLHPLLAIVLVPAGARLVGVGGAGMGSGLAAVGTEIVTVILLLWRLGRPAVDRQVIKVAGGSLAGALVAMVVGLVLPAALGPGRLPLGLAAYFAVAGLSGSLRVHRYAALARDLLRMSRGGQAKS